MAKKANDILNRVRPKRTGAEALMDTMYEQKHETKLEQDSNQENVTMHETEQFTVQKNETESV